MSNIASYKQANKEYVERVLSLESLIEVHNLVKTRRSVDRDLMMDIAREYPCAASRKINFENYSKYPSEQNVDIALEDIKEVISSSLQVLKKSFISGATGFSKILTKIKENFQTKGSLSNPGIYSETFKFLEDIRKNPILAAMTEDDFSNVILKANNIKVSTASLTDMEIKQNVINDIKFIEEAYDNLFKLMDWREKKTVELTRDIESGKIVGMEDTSKYQLNFGEFLDEDQAASYNDGKKPKDNYLALGDFYITAFSEPEALIRGYLSSDTKTNLFNKDSLDNGDLALFFSSVRKAIAKEKTFPDFFTKFSQKAERTVKSTNAMFAAYDKIAKHTEDISLMLNCIKTLKVALILQQRMGKAAETYIAVIYTVTTDAEAILTQYASILRKKLVKINKPESLKLAVSIAKHPFLKQFIFLKAGASLESAINETDENEIHYIEPELDASEMEEDEDYDDKMDVTALVGEPVTLGTISTEGVMENIKNAVAKAWVAIINFFKKIYNWFTGLFKKKESSVSAKHEKVEAAHASQEKKEQTIMNFKWEKVTFDPEVQKKVDAFFNSAVTKEIYKRDWSSGKIKMGAVHALRILQNAPEYKEKTVPVLRKIIETSNNFPKILEKIWSHFFEKISHPDAAKTINDMSEEEFIQYGKENDLFVIEALGFDSNDVFELLFTMSTEGAGKYSKQAELKKENSVASLLKLLKLLTDTLIPREDSPEDVINDGHGKFNDTDYLYDEANDIYTALESIKVTASEKESQTIQRLLHNFQEEAVKFNDLQRSKDKGGFGLNFRQSVLGPRMRNLENLMKELSEIDGQLKKINMGRLDIMDSCTMLMLSAVNIRQDRMKVASEFIDTVKDLLVDEDRIDYSTHKDIIRVLKNSQEKLLKLNLDQKTLD